MQTVGSSLRQQQQPLSRLIELCRIAGNSISSDDIAGLVKLNPGPTDRRLLTRRIGCNTSASNSSPLALQLHAQTLRVRTFASTAEFSGGTFNVSSSSSESDDSRQRDQDVDDKELLLESALQYVGEKGWSDAALISGARHIGFSPAAIGLLPRGPAELVEYFENKCNMELASKLQSCKTEWQHMRTTQRVKEGLKMRLEMNAPYIDTWAQALRIRAQPRNVSAAVEQLAQITDDVWHAAGDKSTDYNWYTKRGLLAGVYTATELYMLTDYSPGFADTWDVLDRRLKDVMTIGRVMGQMGSSAASLMEQISSGLSQLISNRQAQYTR
ncbi:hypothetical protein WJX79_001942 [Trebouxia sp. C0005]